MPKIIVIDDEQLIMEIVKSYLDTNFEVLMANNLNEVLSLVKEHKISAILSDFYMPDLTGEEISLKLKEEHIHIPVILMSGSFLDQEKKLQFANFIKKTF